MFQIKMYNMHNISCIYNFNWSKTIFCVTFRTKKFHLSFNFDIPIKIWSIWLLPLYAFYNMFLF